MSAEQQALETHRQHCTRCTCARGGRERTLCPQALDLIHAINESLPKDTVHVCGCGAKQHKTVCDNCRRNEQVDRQRNNYIEHGCTDKLRWKGKGA